MSSVLVLDAGALIHKQSFPVDCSLLTTSAVLAEVKDPRSKLHTELLPQTLTTKIPTAASIKKVRDFARKTGDLGFLSPNDISVLALVLEESEASGIQIRTDPVTSAADTVDQAKNVKFNWNGEDNEDGWVDVNNFHKIKDSVSSIDTPTNNSHEKSVAIVTGDYSVQNVSLQMGINVQSYEGLRVRFCKQWGLLCVACWGITRDTQKAFCPTCGIDALRRVSITTDSDGKVTMAGGRPKKPQLKGTIYSIPKRKGGRDNNRPIYAEDEIFIGGRFRQLQKEQRNYEKMLEERLTLGGLDEIKEFDSRSLAPKLVAGCGRRNPNAGNFKWPNKKK
jgi:rRNA maturation endonuclease Nob1